MTMPSDDTVDARSWAVPAHEVTELSSGRSEYCVCIPVINEGEKIAAQLERMKGLALGTDVIIADGGSTDGSMDPDRLRAAGVHTLLVKKGPGRLSAQLRMGLAFAMRQGYRGVVVIDGNNKDDPAAIPTFLRALDQGWDHVQGSRFIPGGVAVNTPVSRLFGIRVIHAPLIRFASGFGYTDTTNGFRAYSRRFLTDPRVAPFRDVFTGYELHYYLAIRAARLRFRVIELPVSRRYPARGPIPTKVRGFRGTMKIVMSLLAACLHRFDPVETRESFRNA